MATEIETIYHDLISNLGLAWASTERIALSGADPIVDSVFRIGEASAAVLGAQAAAVSEIWRRRGGGPQNVQIDATAGALATFSVGYQSQHGFAVPQPEPSYPLVDLYQARDGRWVMLHGAFPLLRNGLLDLLGCSMEPTSIARSVETWDAFELEDAIAACGLCGVVARSRSEWLATPQGRALAQAPLIEITRIGQSVSEPLGQSSRPLAGIRALDLTHRHRRPDDR